MVFLIITLKFVSDNNSAFLVSVNARTNGITHFPVDDVVIVINPKNNDIHNQHRRNKTSLAQSQILLDQRRVNRNNTCKSRYKTRSPLKTKSLYEKINQRGSEPFLNTPLCAMNTETWTKSTAGRQKLISCVRSTCVHIIRNREYSKWSPKSRIDVNKPADENDGKTISAL